MRNVTIIGVNRLIQSNQWNESIANSDKLTRLTISAWALVSLFFTISPWIVDSTCSGFFSFSIARACLGPKTMFKLVPVILDLGSDAGAKDSHPATKANRNSNVLYIMMLGLCCSFSACSLHLAFDLSIFLLVSFWKHRRHNIFKKSCWTDKEVHISLPPFLRLFVFFLLFNKFWEG